MAVNTDIGTTAEAWAEIVIKKWEDNIMRLGIYDSKELLKSFQMNVTREANGAPNLIEFAFLYYGKFADMGVGNGVKAGEYSGTNRKPKMWYSKTFFSQVKRLGDILGEKYAEKGKLAIVENLGN